ncbi:MAG: hypothetical protein J5755_05250, partial [Clostridia bacterium]|nr:hypothetical protein [Clostridia bacterium]
MKKSYFLRVTVSCVAVLIAIVTLSAFLAPTIQASAAGDEDYVVKPVETTHDDNRFTFNITLEKIKEKKKEPS